MRGALPSLLILTITSRGGAAGFLGLAARAAGGLARRRGDLSEAVAQLRVGGNIADALARAPFWPICRLPLVAP